MSSSWRSDKLDRLGSSIFSEVARWRQEASEAGLDVIDLSIGSPDLPPSSAVRQALSEAALRPESYRYPSSQGSIEFRRTAAEWLRHRFGTEVDPETEVVTLMGSQDGLAHLATAICNPGDMAIVPDPGYPIYAASLAVAGVEAAFLPLRAEGGFLPDPDSLPDGIWDKARFVLVGLPGNPIGTAAGMDVLERLVDKARRHRTLLVLDLAYSEMGYGDYRPFSVLTIPGAKEIAVEFHSMSKSFHMAGCRIGFMAGNAGAVGALKELKANIDYGVFPAVQEAAAAALREAMDDSGYAGFRGVYEERRDRFSEALSRAGWSVPKPDATMFLWAALPQPAAGAAAWSSRRFARQLLQDAGVAVVPGDAFGSEGEGYVRIALVESADRLGEAAERIGAWLKKQGLGEGR